MNRKKSNICDRSSLLDLDRWTVWYCFIKKNYNYKPTVHNLYNADKK